MKKKKRLLAVLVFILVIALIVLIILSSSNLAGGQGRHGKARIAVIRLEGPIAKEGFYFTKTSNPDEIISAIKKAQSYDGVLLYIDSPGGSAVSSFKIERAIKNFKTNSTKPVVAYIDEEGLSGAYLVASAADRIYASSMALVGSIGVTASYLEFAGLLERYNISYINLTKGAYKEMANPLKHITESERALLEKKLQLIYDAFIAEVAENRNISKEKALELANGEFFIAEEALEKGLIDKIAYFDEIKAELEQELNKSIELIELTKPSSLIEQIKKLFSFGFYSFGYGIGSGFGDVLKNEVGIKLS